jgi:hypothetical protein
MESFVNSYQAQQVRLVSTSRAGIGTFIIALNRAIPEGVTQDQVAQWSRIPRSTVAAILSIDRVPKTDSIPLAMYENLRRILNPQWPGEPRAISFEDMMRLILKEAEGEQGYQRSRLGQEIEKQLKRNMAREGGQSYEECKAELIKLLTLLPEDGESLSKGALSENQAKERLEEMISGRYTPTTELETAVLAAWLESDDEGSHDQRWVKWICGLLPGYP